MNRQDVLIKADAYGLYDIQINGADFASAYGFETAIAVSFFTDARADAVQVQEAFRRRGWPGNILYADEGLQLGGLLWLLDQARITADTLNFAQAYAQASLAWLLSGDIARSIRVTVERSGARDITILTDIITIENAIQRYITLWRNTDLTRILP